MSGSLAAEEPLTPCQLALNQTSLDAKEVVVRGELHVEFEDSSFVPDCEASSLHIWVMFGGDVETPVVYCCGDQGRTPGSTLKMRDLALPLKRNRQFEEFFKFLNARRQLAPTGVPCFYECYLYRVTATFRGHFFLGKKTTLPDGGVVYRGYGHMGCCSLFVIQEVSDVESKPTAIPREGPYQCERNTTDLAVDRSAVTAKQQAGGKTPEEIVEQVTASNMAATHRSFKDGDTLLSYQGDLSVQKHLTVIWLSKDKLTSYAAQLERFDWLASYAPTIDDRIWTPTSLERVTCKPE
jgi:hypothetical protein